MVGLTRRTWLLPGLCALILFIGALLAEEGAMTKPRYEIAYATYLGGNRGAGAREVIPYPDGSVLIGAQTTSTDMPTTPGVVQSEYAGDDPALGHPGIYGGDCFLARLSPDGQSLLAATYFGGSKQERNVYGMALDTDGNVVITSGTRSLDLPTTPGCFRAEYGGGPHDGFAAKLSPDFKRLLWCTYLGGCWPRGGLTLDEQGNVYVVGGTDSPDFPTTPGVFQRDLKGRDAIILKLKPDGSGLVWSTLLGGSDWDGLMGVRVDRQGDVYVAGHTRSADFPVTAGAPQPTIGGESDSFFAKFSSDASKLLYSTYLGGSGNEFAEHQPLLAGDGALRSPTSSILLTGVTASPDFPTTEGAFQRSLQGETDGFLTKLSADGERFIFSTLLGGSGGEFFLMPTLDAEGNILIVGSTTSPDFPVTPDALQREYGGGKGDGVLAVLSPDGSELVYASYLGGSGNDLIRSVALGPNRRARRPNGEVYLVGGTSSKDFPVTPDAFQTTLPGKGAAFVVKLVPRP